MDDDVGFLAATRNLLEAIGYTTEGFTFARQLLDHGAVQSFDCLLLDMHLDEMSGLELHRQLKATGPTPPVIMMTASRDESARQAALDGGCVEFLQKPFGANQLKAAIDLAAPRASL